MNNKYQIDELSLQKAQKLFETGDIDKMEKYGIYEVLEEDLALCEYVCPSKIDIQSIISDGISLMMKEMA